MEIYNGTYCVYIHTNKINGKMYVGQTIYGDNPKKRWKGGSGYSIQPYFWRAIQKYGWDNFDHEVIAANLTKEEADSFEKLLISHLKTNDNNFGYNLTLGGEGACGFHHTDEQIQKQKDAMKEYYSDPQYIQMMRDVAPKRKVYQFTLIGDFVAEYESAMEAQRQTGIHNGDISKCAFGKSSHAKDYIFLFEEDRSEIDQRVDKYRQTKKLRQEAVVQLSSDGMFIKEWPNTLQAGENLGINYKNIRAVCRYERKHAGGFKWMYLSDYIKMRHENSNTTNTTQN